MDSDPFTRLTKVGLTRFAFPRALRQWGVLAGTLCNVKSELITSRRNSHLHRLPRGPLPKRVKLHTGIYFP